MEEKENDIVEDCRGVDYIIEHRFGQGFFFGWTFGLGLLLASLMGALIIRILNDTGLSTFW